MKLKAQTAVLVGVGMVAAVWVTQSVTTRTAEAALAESAAGSTALLAESSRRELERRATVIVAYLSRVASEPTYKLDLGALNQVARETRELKGVKQVEVLNLAGRVLADGEGDAYLKNLMRNDPIRRRAVKSTAPATRWYSNRLVAWGPVLAGGEAQGAVYLEMSLDEHVAALQAAKQAEASIAARALGSMRGDAGVVLGGMLVLAVATSLLFSFALTRPILKVSAAIQKAGTGDLSVRVEAAGNDELGQLARDLNRMLAELQQSRGQLERAAQLEKELQIAQNLQTGILPPLAPVDGLAFAGRMVTATEVGGDYYDVLPREGGTWVAIGDVSGHGLTSGVMMLLVHAAVSVATLRDPTASPAQVLALVNRAVRASVRERLKTNDHMTLTLMRYRGEGRFDFAGAHEVLLVWRKATGATEVVRTPGTWIGVIDDISADLPVSELLLEPGDRLFLYTDGLTEHVGAGAKGELFGLERLRAAVQEASGRSSAEGLIDAVYASLEAFGPGRRDDQTVLVVERRA